ncbi:MAG: tRNA (adenosine(37)-N6)-threonylcarbamoyltransferase complex ATPase subunit type 1 TsaE [Clostridiaceae bacterium]|nr:tRNA (adenosine(37)-N6)-threonylcarbamoyltransferase complex ATPase subunit type 1 TsaE [Clostridiaceae bacterium]
MSVSKWYKTFSEKETFFLGKKIASQLKPGDAISLEGDLGTGKTALTKGIAAGLGINEHITSPSFTIVNTYEGKTKLHHFDVYRIDDPEELFTIGWEEYFTDDAITVVEWGNRVLEIMPDDSIRIKILRDEKDPDTRIINIERPDI